MITFEDFLNAGYEKRIYIDKSRYFAQKWIKGGDKYGKEVDLYCINIYEWSQDFYWLEAGAHFFTKNNQWFSVSFHDVQDEELIENVESFFDEIYSKFNCVPNIHNND